MKLILSGNSIVNERITSDNRPMIIRFRIYKDPKVINPLSKLKKDKTVIIIQSGGDFCNTTLPTEVYKE